MFDFAKLLKQNKPRGKTMEQSKTWKANALFQECLTTLRGQCTVAPSDLQAACEMAVFAAQTESAWRPISRPGQDWAQGTLYILWDEPTLPVLRCPGHGVLAHLDTVCAVSNETWLIREDFTAVLRFSADGSIHTTP